MQLQTEYKVPYKVPEPNNMGVVRYVLALAVLFAHFNILAGYSFYFPVTSYSAVGGFFALSGFLIYGSYLRQKSLKTYILSRARRLLPAYFIIVLFFAIILCGISTFGPVRYFLSSEFWRYLVSNLTFANFLQPSLPGVFEGYEISAVNGSLWTMKVEWALYLTPPIVMWCIHKLRMRPVVMYICIYVFSCVYRIIFLYMYELTGSEIYEILGRQFMGQLSYFYVGVLCYYCFGYFLKYKWPLLAFAVVGIVCVDYIPYGSIIVHPLAVGIMVVWFSMIGKWGTWEGKRDNISYNIYLIHFPVIQLFVYFRGSCEIGLAPALLICTAATWLLAWVLYLPEKMIRRRLSASGAK